MDEEEWLTIPEFPNYQVSNYGRVWDCIKDREVKKSRTQWGHVKVNLTDAFANRQTSRSVALLVASAFVEPLDWRCDHVMILDGDFDHVAAENLTWRPYWFMWKYTRQLKTPLPSHYRHLPVVDVVSGKKYESIYEAGITEGLLFHDIWMSCHNGYSYFPNKAIFEIDAERKAFLERITK